VLGWKVPGIEVVVADASFGTTFPVASGTSFRFFLPQRGSGWAATQIWAATVCSADELDDAAAAPWKSLAANASAAMASRYGWAFAPYLAESFSLFALRFCPDAQRRPPPATLDFTALAQVNSSIGALFRGNSFVDGLGRIGPLNAPHARFEDNVANGTQYGGLLVCAELTWLSGNLGLDDIVVVNNRFTDLCPYARLDYPNGQCNASLYPVFAPCGTTTNLLVANNTVLSGG
jgi:hypothetical protein